MFKRSIRVARGQFLKWKQDYRVWLVFLAETAIIIFYLKGITAYGMAGNKKSTPWVLALLFTDATIANGLLKIQVYFGGILLFCNAPFTDVQSQYMIIRSRRGAWGMGNIFYIISASFLYMLFLMLVSTAVVCPVAGRARNWGDLFGSLLSEEPMLLFQYLGSLVLPEIIIQTVYPAAAAAYTFLAGWLSFSMLGLLIYVLNLTLNQYVAGSLTASFFVLLDPVVRWLAYVRPRFFLYYLSPVSWSSIEHWDFLGKDRPLHGETVLLASLFLILMFSTAVVITEKKKEVRTVLEE